MQLLSMRRPSAAAPVFRPSPFITGRPVQRFAPVARPAQTPTAAPKPQVGGERPVAKPQAAAQPWGNGNHPVEDPNLPRDIASRFGRRVRELRHARAMTQVEVAVHFGIDRTFLSDVERGRKSVCLPTMEVFALGFGLSLSDLLRGL